jgi:2-C-methyl-D-erythritol 2,4-cyclodiphosphate synthase
MKVGIGYDVHRLTRDRKLILGGVEIPCEMGLYGHSDADVLIHAVMDALLGAAALKDIGYHFPDTDPVYKDVSSIKLLGKVREMLEEHMYLIENIDAVIVAQKPKLRPYIDQMTRNIAEALKVEDKQVNVKATTEEGLGFTGHLEGISAHAVCSIVPALDYMQDDRVSSSCAGCGGCPRLDAK